MPQAKKVLILGRNGQVARELSALAPICDATVITAGRPELDMTRPDTIEAIMKAVTPAVVINATAYTAVDKAEAEPGTAFALNRDGPACLAQWCAQHDAALLHISSDYVFDGEKTAPYLESDPVGPLGVYGASKEAGESAIRAVCPRHVILRTSWVYSVHGTNFVKTMLRLSRERNALRVVADQHGAPTAASDIATTLFRIAEAVVDAPEGDPRFGTYHYSGGGETTWYGFAEYIFQCLEQTTGSRPDLKPIATIDYPTPARRPKNSRLDCRFIYQMFGVEQPAWQKGVDCVTRELIQ